MTGCLSGAFDGWLPWRWPFGGRRADDALSNSSKSPERNVANLRLRDAAELAQRFPRTSERAAAAQVRPPGGRRSPCLPRRLVSVIRFTSRKRRESHRQREVRKERRDPWPHPRPLISRALEGADQSRRSPRRRPGDSARIAKANRLMSDLTSDRASERVSLH